jgi:hypothetical protein
LHFLDLAGVSAQQHHDFPAQIGPTVTFPAAVQQAVAHLPENLAGVTFLLDAGKLTQQSPELVNDGKREDLEIIRSILVRAQAVDQTDDLLDSLSSNGRRGFDLYGDHERNPPEATVAIGSIMVLLQAFGCLLVLPR